MSHLQAALFLKRANPHFGVDSAGAEKSEPAQRTVKSRGPQFRLANSPAPKHLL